MESSDSLGLKEYYRAHDKFYQKFFCRVSLTVIV